MSRLCESSVSGVLSDSIRVKRVCGCQRRAFNQVKTSCGTVCVGGLEVGWNNAKNLNALINPIILHPFSDVEKTTFVRV